MSFTEGSEHLRIAFADIEVATKNFTTLIGKGGFGLVYRGELLISGVLRSVAVKRLDSKITGQGFKEFLTEIHLLSNYNHPNLISLFGFCDEGQEKILIYEYADHGSLDRYITPNSVPPLSWMERINICVGAAQALDYLHNGVAEKHRIIHRDIKASNILLDQNWKPIISDLGLSRISVANEKDTFVITNIAGTQGYCDPAYYKTGILTKKSDVYSFGVVLLEVLCGRPFFMDVQDERRFLVHLAQKCYENGKLDEIIDPDLREQMNLECLNEFATIAYRCIQEDRELRPSIDEVVHKLQEAWEFQDSSCLYENQDDDKDAVVRLYREIINRLDTPLEFTTKKQLYSHLAKGVFIDGGEMLISMDKQKNNHKLISATKFIDPNNLETISIMEMELEAEKSGYDVNLIPKSRFPVMKLFPMSKLNIEIDITTQFLSSQVAYACYFVSSYIGPMDRDDGGESHISIARRAFPLGVQYNVNGKEFITHSSKIRDDGWILTELFVVPNHKENDQFKVLIQKFVCPVKNIEEDDVFIEGLEFLPIEKTEEMKEGSQNSYTKREFFSEFFPNKQIREDRQNELDESYLWSWLSKSSGKKCFIIGAIQIIDGDYELQTRIEDELKFVNVALIPIQAYMSELKLEVVIPRRLFSPNTLYAMYLVYKLPNDLDMGELRMIALLAELLEHGKFEFEMDQKRLICLALSDTLDVRPQEPVIIGENGRIEREDYMSRSDGILPSKRIDGWSEVMLWHFVYDKNAGDGAFLSAPATTTITNDYQFKMSFKTEVDFILPLLLQVQGLEFRPIN